MTTIDEADPRGLIRESYRIEGITEGECRSIFLDWALSVTDGTATGPLIQALLDHYGPKAEAHPMTGVLAAGLKGAAAPTRRGGRRGRVEG